MIGRCRVCNEIKELAKGQIGLCREHSLAYQREYRKRNRDRLKAYHAEKLKRQRQDPQWVSSQRKRGRKYWADLRHEGIMAYGGYRCACCGETEPKFLTLDHIFNDGSAHRKKIKNRGAGIFKWLKDHSYPADFQILCMNCNHGKALNNGICPHEAESSYENQVNSGKVQTGQS